MVPTSPPILRHREPSFAELFTPKLVTVLREGYGIGQFRQDALAGLTVAIVALPLSMAIAIASGVGPDRGLYTAIIGGFLVSLLGGSRFQIGGPAGAFIVLIAAIVERHGYDGLVLATVIAGLIMMAVGFLRLGAYVKYIPYPVTVGFTAGIAVIIFASQLRELFGLTLAQEPAAFMPKIAALWDARGTFNPEALGVGCLALAIILGLRRYRPSWPGLLIAVVAASLAVWLFHLDVATVGSRFGGVPSTLPAPALPAFTWEKFHAVLPDAFAIALLGAIESLLSAVVADGMTGRRHRSNCELVAQGTANIGSVLFGGIPVTGTIARTATNIRSGAKGPVSGIMHALYLLLFILVAAPLAAHIPLASLGAVLAIVSWNMAEKDEFAVLVRASAGDRLVVLATFGLTVLTELTTAIAVGVVLGAFLFMHRMAEAMEVEGHAPVFPADKADEEGSERLAYDPAIATDADILVYRISGALFFGATASLNSVLDRTGRPKLFVLDLSEAPLVDSTAAKALEHFVHRLRQSGTLVYFAGASRPVRRVLLTAGLRKPLVRYAASADAAIAYGREFLASPAEAAPGARADIVA
jgi:sulfate permease, SulP family